MLVDSQAAIKALIKCTVTSITVFSCIGNLNQLGKQNHVSIAWIPGHAGVHSNEVANYVAKSGSKSKIHNLNFLVQSRMPAANHYVSNCKLYQDILVKYFGITKTTVHYVAAKCNINKLAMYLKEAGRLSEFDQ